MELLRIDTDTQLNQILYISKNINKLGGIIWFSLRSWHSFSGCRSSIFRSNFSFKFSSNFSFLKWFLLQLRPTHHRQPWSRSKKGTRIQLPYSLGKEIYLPNRSLCLAICYPGPPDHHNSANLKVGKKFCYLFEILFLIHSTKTI